MVARSITSKHSAQSRSYGMPRIVEGVEKYVRSCPCLSVRECVSASFADIARITAGTGKLVDNIRTKFNRHTVLHTKHATDLERRKG